MGLCPVAIHCRKEATMKEIRVLVTVQVDECDPEVLVDPETMEDAAVDAIENAVKHAELNGFVFPQAEDLCIGFVDAVLYEECGDNTVSLDDTGEESP
jgi:hypothetical protein